jgi:WXG100 family type VII secretion target
MSAGTIKFSQANAEQAAKSIENKGNNAASIIASLDREVQSLKDWWKGPSAEAFIDQFNILKPNMNKLVECVNGISNQIRQIAKIKQEAEGRTAEQLRGI